MNHSSKVQVCRKWIDRYRKRYLGTTYPEKISHRPLFVHEIRLPWPRASMDHEIRQPRFLHFLNDAKKIFWKICFFSQNRSIRRNNMFWVIFERSTWFFSLLFQRIQNAESRMQKAWAQTPVSLFSSYFFLFTIVSLTTCIIMHWFLVCLRVCD